MAKMFITGTARSPSTEEFKQRVARLAEMPALAASPASGRRNKPAKPSFAQQPLRHSSDDAETDPAGDASNDTANDTANDTD